MPDVRLKTRIQNKYKTLNEWNEIAAGDFIPLKGEVCYAIDGNMVFQKIGDGLTDFTELDWLLSPSVQSDHAENDEQSFAYIKNRLGYDTLVEVPEDKQLIKDMTKINTITYPKEILHQALPDLAALLPTHINTYLIEQLNMDDGDGISDFNPFKVALNSFVADVNNIFTSEKLSISENQNFILMAAGNPVFINIWIILSETNLPLYPMDYNLDKDYCVFFALSQANNSFYGTFIGDLDIYNADTYSIQLKHIMENSTKPIDSRFLVNAKSDWDEMDSSKTSYIYNKYGNIVTMYAEDSLIDYKSGFYEGNFTIGTVYADGIELIENNTSYEGWTLQYKDLPLINTKVYLSLGEKHFSYDGCPVFFGQDFFTTKDGNTLIYVGNPYFISKSYYIYRGAADHLQIADQNDNGLPFLFGFDFTKTPSLVKCFMDNSLLDETNKTYNLTIGSNDIAISTRMIPNYLITAKEKEPWIYDEVKQSLMAPTAYEASGIGSFATGIGTKATYKSQAVIGQYNVNEDKAFIIGQGEADNNRKNIFSVDREGNTRATSLILTSPNGTEFKISVDNAGNIITEDEDGNIVNAFSIQPNNNGNNSLVIGGI